jgi:hypothetical protein
LEAGQAKLECRKEVERRTKRILVSGVEAGYMSIDYRTLVEIESLGWQRKAVGSGLTERQRWVTGSQGKQEGMKGRIHVVGGKKSKRSVV